MIKSKNLAFTFIDKQAMDAITHLCKDMSAMELVGYRSNIFNTVKNVYTNAREILSNELIEQKQAHQTFVDISNRIMKYAQLPEDAIAQHHKLIKSGQQFITDIENYIKQIDLVYQSNYNSLDEFFEEVMFNKMSHSEYKYDSK